ncbi:hypothetical protein OG21DRAFT_1506870 [Imleria badia]|nr:hypothetical protein OG21DRAFT_1506870 [Imleria badia]
MRSFRTSNVRYPPPSSHPSRPPFDTLEDMIKDSMEPTGDSYSTSRKRVLARDGYRCAITGVYDELSRDRCTELGDLRGVASVSLEMAHIFHESTMQNIDPAVNRDSENFRAYNKTYNAAGALAILKSFGFSKFADAFTEPGGVHEAWNLISFQHDVHTSFDRLAMWLEYTEMPHRYKVCTAHEDKKLSIHQFAGHDRQDYGADMFVEFNLKLQGVLPPDPFLLALHATCARVAHMSGAAEFFDQVQWDAEETRVLASDGSSSTLLDHLLTPFAVIPERVSAYELVYV